MEPEIIYERTAIVPEGEVWLSDGEKLYKLVLPTGFGEIRAIALPHKKSMKDFDWNKPHHYFKNDESPL